MKILFLLHSSKLDEGSSVAAFSIIKELMTKGHRISAVCPQDGDLVDALYNIGINVSIIDYSIVMYPKVVTFKSFFSWPKRMLEILWKNHCAENKLRKLIQHVKPDLIHTNVGVLRVGYYVSQKLGIPHVWHIRECYCPYPSLRYQKKLLQRNCYNLAITEAVKNFYSLKDDNSRVVYDGVFSEGFKAKLNKKSNYFLFVGRIVPLKAPDWAVNSFLMIADRFPEMELWMAGPDNSPFANELKGKIKHNPNSSRIKFLGSRNDIYDLISSAQAVLVTSAIEGFGFVTVEAMLNDTIVIGRNVSGTKEQFDNGYKLKECEIALRCDSIVDMATHMEAVCRYGQDYYKDMKIMANDVVRQLYTIEQNTDKIEQIYREISK